MPTFDEIFSVLKEFLPLITAGGVAALAAGLIPRISPGRAVWIALRSRFAFKPVPESIRFEEAKLLKSRLADKDFGQGYLVVIGEKGVGKSCLLSTVTSKMPGVITVEAQPSDNENTIIKNTLQQLTNPLFKSMNPLEMAPRVIFWYRFFTLGRSPIVIINAAERRVGQEYAGLAGAVRTLVDNYKLRVVVDGSPNSLDETLLRTKRQSVFDIKPMTKEMIWQLEQLQDLFKYVKEAGCDDTVFAVLGGIPAEYEGLWENVKTDLQDGQDAREAIGTHLCAEISAAIKLVMDAQDMDEIIKLLDKDSNIIPSHLLKDKKLKRPISDKIFHEHSLRKEPTLSELEELLKTRM
ncbi:hypothetical protein BDEG_27711 [Batrachochytrium dendrobatidis JEL423]|uniref:ORC1/DEAH AAA+ ATPase domain-containing protein n=1 Tax=Batrachochytrium dendrobatidis (strain JEL423) TaxID=403673 RepID=A0A177WWP6_BATDL|nr:hypothetical protein BDEG_27711 [Batrachochytrium dendrobatidis JEL423]